MHQTFHLAQPTPNNIAPASTTASNIVVALRESQAASVLDYWGLFIHQKSLLIMFATLGLVSGLVITFLQKPVYRAVTALEILQLQDSKDALTWRLLNPPSESGQSDPLIDVQTQIRILQSRALVENALVRVGALPVQDVNARPLRITRDRERVIKKTIKNLKVTQSGQTRIVEVSFDATNP